LVCIDWYQQYIEYHRQYNSSIIMVLSQYGSDGFLTVWYRNGTDSGYLHKIFDVLWQLQPWVTLYFEYQMAFDKILVKQIF
jgi:hypothetical protein